jgi:hypothetical protein
MLTPRWLARAACSRLSSRPGRLSRTSGSKIDAILGDGDLIDAILGDGDLVAAVGAASRGLRADEGATRLVWLIRLKDGQMTEIWTYRDMGR